MYNSETELLSVSVTATGATTIKRILGITRWTFILGILFTCLGIAALLLHDSFTDPEKYVSIKPLYWELKYHDWSFGIYAVLFVFQLYTYLQFARKCHRGIDTLDVEQFNGSFYFLYRASVLAVIASGLSILLSILDVWANMVMANLAHGNR
jgi:hypothetical protein